ncbi:MAG: metallophosphoesterase family protein [Chloroflexota bacterium]
MRIALISDIHGNLVSLEAVLADIDRQNVNEIIFLGDAATLGPQPHEVLHRLRQLGCPCIIGNHETYLFKPSLGQAYMRGTQWFSDILTWCRARLTPEDYQFMRSFQPMLKVKLEGESTLICFHGSPRRHTDNIFATTPTEEVNEMLAGRRATVMAGGHTHVQMMRQHIGVLLVNSGSVGLPFEQMPFTDRGPRVMPWAEYAIITSEGNAISVDLRRIPVNMKAIKQAGIDARMPKTSDWLRNWISITELLSEI